MYIYVYMCEYDNTYCMYHMIYGVIVMPGYVVLSLLLVFVLLVIPTSNQ